MKTKVELKQPDGVTLMIRASDHTQFRPAVGGGGHLEVQPLSSYRWVSHSAQQTLTGTGAWLWWKGSFSQKTVPALVPLLWHENYK